MAAISDNKYDVYNWIIKVIDSCETYYHWSTVNNLIDNFRSRYTDLEMSGRLREYAYRKQYKSW